MCSLEDMAMRTIVETIPALVLAGAVLAPQSVSGASIVRARASGAADFQKYLPALPADVPWLLAERQAPEERVLPEAGSVRALMLVPQPAEGWAVLTSEPAALRSSAGRR